MQGGSNFTPRPARTARAGGVLEKSAGPPVGGHQAEENPWFLVSGPLVLGLPWNVQCSWIVLDCFIFQWFGYVWLEPQSFFH